MDQRG